MIEANMVALGLSVAPYVAVSSGKITRPHLPMSTFPAGTVNGCAFSPDGSKLAVAISASPGIVIYNTSNWSKLANPASLPNGNAYGCAFSPDGSKLAVVYHSSPYLTVYNTSDWSAITLSGPTGQGNCCAFSPDGSKLAVGHGTAPYVTVYNTSDWSKISGLAALSTVIPYGCAFSPDGSKLAVAHYSYPHLAIYNTSNWSLLTGLPALNGIGYGCAFSPDGSKLAVAHANSPFYKVLNTADWSALSIPGLIAKHGTITGRSVGWQSEKVVLSSSTSSPGVYFIDPANNRIDSVIEFPGSVYALGLMSTTLWEVNGTIAESLAAADWTACAYDLDTGDQLSSVDFTGTTFTLPIARPEPVSVTVSAKQGDMWTASTLAILGAKVFPTNPSATPYYYVCTTAGTTGISEPVFPITEGGTVTDGTVVWTRVERLIQPVTQSPLIPTVA